MNKKIMIQESHAGFNNKVPFQTLEFEAQNKCTKNLSNINWRNKPKHNGARVKHLEIMLKLSETC